MGAPHWRVSSVRTFWGLTRAAASVSGEAAQEHGEGCRSRPAAVVRSATAVLAGAAHLSGQSSAAGLIRATPE